MALIRRIGFTRFDRWGANLGRLHVSKATHTDALDGTDELKITCDDDLSKGDRIVWIDLQGVCHEHIVDDVKRTHGDDNVTRTEATCINSIAETWDDWIDDKRPNGSASVALESVLSDTRWKAGTSDQGGNASRTFYHTSVREAIAGIVETWGGELETLIVHDGASVVSRSASIRSKRGRRDSAKRFTWTKDLLSVKRTVASENPKTRVYGYGKGVETEGGGFGRRLTFGEINGGKDYVEDAEATSIWGHPDGDGGILPASCSYVNEQCDDAVQLLKETREYLERAKEPRVTYEAAVIDLCAFGRSWEGVGVGDDVAIIDKGFSDDGIRLRGRVSKIERDLLSGGARVTFGNLTDAMADMWQGVSNALHGNSQQNAIYDAVAGTSVPWLQQLQAALNAQFNAVGTYKVETFELGTMWSNVPIDAATGLPLKPTSGMWAVNINGAGIRLAANLAPDGNWDWRTFLTGAQVSADAINTGTMRAERVRAGLLTDEAGKNYWDLSTGEFSLSSTAKIGDSETGKLVLSADVEYGLSENDYIAPTQWSTSADWQQGKCLWQRVKMTLSDRTVQHTKPVVIASADGIGVSKVTEQYYMSTSSTTQSGGYWSDAQQSWMSGRHYWTRSQIKWSDGSITYTTPTLARALTSANQSTNDLDKALTQREVFNRLTNNGQTQGIYLSGNKLYINGEYIRAGTISTDRIETSRSSNTYMNVGQTSDGYTGTSFFTRGNNYLNIASVHAVDSPQGAINGVGFETFNKAFLDASSYYRTTILETPEFNGFMNQSNERLAMMSGTGWYVNLLAGGNGQRGLFMDGNDLVLQFDNTNYVRITSGGVQCRCGSKGFGWLDGRFYDNLTWS